MRNSGEGTGGSPPSGSLLFIVYSFALLDVLLSNVSGFFFFQNLPGAECTMANRTEVPQSGARQKVEFRGGGAGTTQPLSF